MNDQPTLTIGDIYKRLPAYRTHQVRYAITEYQIEPRARAGIIRLWAEADVPRILSALQRIASRREVCRV